MQCLEQILNRNRAGVAYVFLVFSIDCVKRLFLVQFPRIKLFWTGYFCSFDRSVKTYSVLWV